MRNPFLKVALIPAVLLLVFASGCNLVDSPDANFSNGGSVVLKETFCVTFNEFRTSGSFESEVVSDQFNAQIAQWLADNNVDPANVRKIFMFMSSGLICLNSNQGHPWDITSKVKIKRQDIHEPTQNLLRTQTVTIPDSFDPCYSPRMVYRGVRVVNRALNDFIDGGDPILRLTMAALDVDPEPTVQDPLIFSWDACIEILVQVNR